MMALTLSRAPGSAAWRNHSTKDPGAITAGRPTHGRAAVLLRAPLCVLFPWGNNPGHQPAFSLPRWVDTAAPADDSRGVAVQCQHSHRRAHKAPSCHFATGESHLHSRSSPNPGGAPSALPHRTDLLKQAVSPGIKQEAGQAQLSAHITNPGRRSASHSTQHQAKNDRGGTSAHL